MLDQLDPIRRLMNNMYSQLCPIMKSKLLYEHIVLFFFIIFCLNEKSENVSEKKIEFKF